MAEAIVREYSTVRCTVFSWSTRQYNTKLRHTDKPPYFSAREMVWRLAFGVTKGRELRYAIRSWRVRDRSTVRTQFRQIAKRELRLNQIR